MRTGHTGRLEGEEAKLRFLPGPELLVVTVTASQLQCEAQTDNGDTISSSLLI